MTARKLVKPTPPQAAWQDLEVGLFIHFGIYTFKEPPLPGLGKPRLHPDVFNPSALDTDQWMEAARAIGAKYAVLTAKHQYNFCLWPTRAYDYSVKYSKWRRGKGDLVADFVRSCRKYGIKPGLYCCLPPGLKFELEGGRKIVEPGTPKWKWICETLLTEIWSNYGELVEVWFDASTIPVEKGGPDLMGLLRRYQPKAVICQSPMTNVRVVGGEEGCAPYPCWSTMKQARSQDCRSGGDPNGKFWCPGECDTTSRGLWQWAWRPGDDHVVKPTEELLEMYYKSVGRNCNLLLNLAPDTRGLVPKSDMQMYKRFGREVQRRFGKSIAETAGEGGSVELVLPREQLVDHIITMEDIREGERVREYVLEALVRGKWRKVRKGISIGHKRIDAFPAVRASAMRLRVTRSVAKPLIRRLAAYHCGIIPRWD